MRGRGAAIPRDEPVSDDTDEDLVDELCEIEEGLTGWEMDFAESVAKQVEAWRPLTERQREMIEKILTRLGR